MYSGTSVIYLIVLTLYKPTNSQKLNMQTGNDSIEVENKTVTVAFPHTYSLCYYSSSEGKPCLRTSDPISCSLNNGNGTCRKRVTRFNSTSKETERYKEQVEPSVSVYLNCVKDTDKILLHDIKYMIPLDKDDICPEIKTKVCENNTNYCINNDCLDNSIDQDLGVISISTMPPSEWIDHCQSSTNGTCNLIIPRQKVPNNLTRYCSGGKPRSSAAKFSYCYSRWVKVTYICEDKNYCPVESGVDAENITTVIQSDDHDVKVSKENNKQLIALVAVSTALITSLVWLLIVIYLCVRIRRLSTKLSKDHAAENRTDVKNQSNEKQTLIEMENLMTGLGKPSSPRENPGNNNVIGHNELIDNNYYESESLRPSSNLENAGNEYEEQEIYVVNGSGNAEESSGQNELVENTYYESESAKRTSTPVNAGNEYEEQEIYIVKGSSNAEGRGHNELVENNYYEGGEQNSNIETAENVYEEQENAAQKALIENNYYEGKDLNNQEIIDSSYYEDQNLIEAEDRVGAGGIQNRALIDNNGLIHNNNGFEAQDAESSNSSKLDENVYEEQEIADVVSPINIGEKKPKTPKMRPISEKPQSSQKQQYNPRRGASERSRYGKDNKRKPELTVAGKEGNEGNYVYTYAHFKLEGRQRQPQK